MSKGKEVINMTEAEKVEKMIKDDETLTAENKFMLRINAAVKEFIGTPVIVEEVEEIEMEVQEEINPSLYKSIIQSLDK